VEFDAAASSLVTFLAYCTGFFLNQMVVRTIPKGNAAMGGFDSTKGGGQTSMLLRFLQQLARCTATTLYTVSCLLLEYCTWWTVHPLL